MSLKKILRSKQDLGRILTTFDNFISIGERLNNAKIISLPKWMRLADYLIVSNPHSHFQISAEGEFFACESQGHKSLPSQSFKDKVSIRCGNTVLNHEKSLNIKRLVSHPLWIEHLYTINDEEEKSPQASLYSGYAKFMAGHDYNNINKVGSIIFIDDEKFFRHFLLENKLNLARDEYNVKTSTYELAITPEFDVKRGNFNKTVNEVIERTNTVLKILKERYSKHSEYFKIPKI